MTKKEKEKEVEFLRNQFNSIAALVLTDYRGLTVAEMTELRGKLRQEQAGARVLKNTLVRLAYKDTDVALLEEDIVGPRAAVWTESEDAAPAMAKVLVEFAKNHPNLELVSGVVNGRKMSSDDVETLSKLPPREVLLGRLLGGMISPVGAFVNTLAAVPRSLLNVLNAIKEQKEATS